MNQWIEWCTTHRPLVKTFVAIYFVVNVVIHDEVQGVAITIIDALTIRGANLLVIAIALAAVACALPWLLRRLRGGPRAGTRALYCLATALFVLAAGMVLSAINSEAIHFVQYGLLAAMLFGVLRRAGETIALVTLLGAIDEGYQYWVLHRHWGVYYDFNDVVLNLLGAAAGVLVVILSVGAGGRDEGAPAYALRDYLRSGAFATLAVVGVAAIVLFATGVMTVNPTTDPESWTVLRRCGPPSAFWTSPDWGRSYHVLTPWEGAAVTLLLLALYVPLDLVADWLPRPAARPSSQPNAAVVANGSEPA